MKYISTTLSIYKMDTWSISTALSLFKLFFFLTFLHTQKVIALVGSNGLKAARMHSRYPSTPQLGRYLSVTTEKKLNLILLQLDLQRQTSLKNLWCFTKVFAKRFLKPLYG